MTSQANDDYEFNFTEEQIKQIREKLTIKRQPQQPKNTIFGQLHRVFVPSAAPINVEDLSDESDDEETNIIEIPEGTIITGIVMKQVQKI